MPRENTIQQIEELKLLPNLKFEIREKTTAFTTRLFYTLFDNATPVEKNIEGLGNDFLKLLDLLKYGTEKQGIILWNSFCEKLPEILRKLRLDAQTINENDPAANSLEEIYLAYPGFYAIAIYRLSHELYKFELPLVPRLMAECAHRLTGVDINPGAAIGVPFFIDHATGVVIGETTVIKNNVKIYQGVTLGALYVNRQLRKVKRHPTIEDNVTIYANATILGGDTIIGANSIIGGNVWLTSSVPENSMVSHTPQIVIKKSEIK
jgi:serine O-acetyltransferase